VYFYLLRQGGYIFTGVYLFVNKITKNLLGHFTKFGGQVAHVPEQLGHLPYSFWRWRN